MKYNPDIHHRKSIRLKNYDYSKQGIYFVTICTQNKEHLFGEIIDGEMILNDAGKMIEKCWNEMYQYFHNMNIDNYVIMPNHFHALIEIECPDAVGAESISAQSISVPLKLKQFHNVKSGSNRADTGSAPTQNANIPKIIQSFKRYTTVEYIKLVKQNILPSFNKRVWQRNYYENIIRNDRMYMKVLDYIETNPLKWNDDIYNE